MFTTSLTAVAVAGFLASASVPSLTPWQTSYAKAAALSAELKKPIAVFVTEGGQGRLVEEGSFPAEVARLLSEKYIPLHIDTATPQGKKLAESFEIQTGLVISDQVGEKQALRHMGKMSTVHLTGYLERFASVTTVATTENRGHVPAPVLSGIHQASYQPTYQPSANRPVLNAIQNFGNMVGQPFGGFVGGG